MRGCDCDICQAVQRQFITKPRKCLRQLFMEKKRETKHDLKQMVSKNFQQAGAGG
jgi:hypothetical protein